MSKSPTDLPEKAMEPALAMTQSLAQGKREPESAVVGALDRLSAAVGKELAHDQPPPADSFRARSASSAQSDAHGDDECLDSYLEKYMQRLTGKAPGGNPTEPAPSPGPAQTAAPAEPPPARTPTQAPEQRDQLAAMRELANDSARRAVTVSREISQVIQIRKTYIAAKAISLFSSTMAVVFFVSRSPIAVCSASLLLVVAAALTLRFCLLCRRHAAT